MMFDERVPGGQTITCRQVLRRGECTGCDVRGEGTMERVYINSAGGHQSKIKGKMRARREISKYRNSITAPQSGKVKGKKLFGY